MFLLFRRNGIKKFKGTYIYIPICFYYFVLDSARLWGVRTFTFQYVSIISTVDAKVGNVDTSFTFQYVSIISV